LKNGDLIITANYGKYLALLQFFLRFGEKPHLLRDIEWYEERRNKLLTFLKEMMNRLIAKGIWKIGLVALIDIGKYSNYYGIDKKTFICFPFCTDLDGMELGVEDENYMCTAGGVQRDYETLISAIRRSKNRR
jgi:hypothetical protein